MSNLRNSNGTFNSNNRGYGSLAYKHGGVVGGKKTRLYITWQGMKRRCYNTKCNRYNSYGARGITVCDEWTQDFKTFMIWAMSNGYTDKLQIDRINNDGDYEPSNCRFVTNVENSINRSNTKLTWEKVNEIRTRYKVEKAKDISKDYNITTRYVYQIIQNKRWVV